MRTRAPRRPPRRQWALPRQRALAAAWIVACAGAAVAQPAEPPPEPPAILGTPAAFAPIQRAEEILVAAGTALHHSPAPRAPISDVIDAPTTVVVAERKGAWARVRWSPRNGWVLLADPDGLGDELTPLDALPTELRPPALDAARLAAARAQLGDHRSHAIGGYRLDTDLRSTVVTQRLLTVLGRLDAGLGRRLGLAPVPAADEAVVVYEHAAAFRDFMHGDPATAGAGANHLGQANAGLATLTVAGLTVQQIEAVFVHEVAHLAIRRGFGLGLPPWLEEGIAEDLAYLRRDDRGRWIAGSLTLPSERRLAERIDRRGRVRFTVRELSGVAARRALRTAFDAGARPGLEALTAMSVSTFYGGPDRLRYPKSAFFVRYLLAEHGPGFQRFLRALARGGEGGPGRLLAHLGAAAGERQTLLTWSELDRRFAAWIRATGEPA